MAGILVGNTQLVRGGSERIPQILAHLRSEGFDTKGNPDIYIRSYRSFGVDEAREIRERATLRAVGERRVFIVAAADINREAQNALLKTTEESPGNALFFFVVPAPETLLPTFRSRAQILEVDVIENSSLVDAKKFLAAPSQKRLDMLKPLLQKGEDDKRDLGAIITFLSSLEAKLEGQPEGLEAVYRARKYVADKGALVKPLLEQVALLA